MKLSIFLVATVLSAAAAAPAQAPTPTIRDHVTLAPAGTPIIRDRA